MPLPERPAGAPAGSPPKALVLAAAGLGAVLVVAIVAVIASSGDDAGPGSPAVGSGAAADGPSEGPEEPAGAEDLGAAGPAADPGAGDAAAPPPAPTGLAARADGGDAIEVTWTASGPAELQRAEDRDGEPGAWEPVGDGATTPPYREEGLPPGATVRYRVRTPGEPPSPWSEAAAATTPPGVRPWRPRAAPREGQLVPEGRADYVEEATPIEELTEVARVAASGSHSLALTEDGRLWTWGWTWGEDGRVSERVPRRELPAPAAVAAVACGNRHDYVLDEEGRVYARGASENGALGSGRIACVATPTPVLPSRVD